MSDSTQQYILAKPIDWQDALDINDYMGGNELFVPLDIPAIEKQLEEIKDDLYGQVEYEAVVYGGQVEENAFEMHVKDAIYDALDQIKVLFGLENTESEK